ncbi:polysaccharide deacetylase family protein [Sporosarcina sp. USHLN248]|uniref:polysaccharide deacetylase family protein n=1 Tax=Sporosarcina sp. USHLN248 TaxID=3081300 RepID=UPI00301674B3
MFGRMGYMSVFALFLLTACQNEPVLENEQPDAMEQQSVSEEDDSGMAEKVVDSEEISEEAEDEESIAKIEPQYELNPETYSIVPIGDANPKVVLLTIDDAPDKRALDMAKTLKELDAPAIFFVNGHFITTEEKETALKEIYEMGFMIGNHTKTHANLKSLSEEEQREEILFVNDKVEEITGERPHFFRAPFGVNTDFSRELAKAEGMQLMNWSYGYDFEKEYMTKDKIADIMVNTELLRDGANLLMHDREWTADALDEIVTGLREKGYELVDPHFIKGFDE